MTPDLAGARPVLLETGQYGARDQTVNMEQVSQACTVIERHLTSALQAIHLYGSALDGGLKPYSDIDLLVTVDVPLEESIRRALLLDLLTVSEPPGTHETRRALEVTVLVSSDVVPWRYPARRELQFGEWLRQDLLAGIFEPPVVDHDLAILLTTARQRSVALGGPTANTLFAPVPREDFVKALATTVANWNSAPDWVGDERNVVLTLARIWYTAATGRIAPKDRASAWVLTRLPVEHRPVLHMAQAAYLGLEAVHLENRRHRVAAFVRFAKCAIGELLEAPGKTFPADG